MQIQESIRQYIAKNLLFSENGFAYSDSASFLNEGIVDSVGVMELVAFVDQEFGIEVEPDEISPENFDSVERIAKFVEGKKALAAKG
jgi:acyl carrier protein